MNTPLARFDITADQISTVMSRFYAAIRQHETLGPVFAAHIENWPEHEEKIASFWRSAILFEGSFEGNPMRAHLGAPEIQADHFAQWLALFDETLETTLPPHTAASFSALAHRIGQGLRLGIQDRDRAANTPPQFT